jgi:hypothetical protein
MENKICEMKEMIINRLYETLKNGNPMSAETYLGIASIVVRLSEQKSEPEEDTTETDLI